MVKKMMYPISISRKIMKFLKCKKKLIVIKNGDHSLSKKNNLKRLIKEISLIYNKLRPSRIVG